MFIFGPYKQIQENLDYRRGAWSPSRLFMEAVALRISLKATLGHTICSIFSKRLDWFSFGKEVASPTKIIRID